MSARTRRSRSIPPLLLRRPYAPAIGVGEAISLFCTSAIVWGVSLAIQFFTHWLDAVERLETALDIERIQLVGRDTVPQQRDIERLRNAGAQAAPAGKALDIPELNEIGRMFAVGKALRVPADPAGVCVVRQVVVADRDIDVAEVDRPPLSRRSPRKPSEEPTSAIAPGQSNTFPFGMSPDDTWCLDLGKVGCIGDLHLRCRSPW